eukprot:1355263-Amorphochlora_amoeboformis.AAC.1
MSPSNAHPSAQWVVLRRHSGPLVEVPGTCGLLLARRYTVSEPRIALRAYVHDFPLRARMAAYSREE